MRHAFSLVEMSIVLIIIALVAGGVMVGQNMIRNAKIKEVITQYATFRHAALSFKEQYQFMPGDMPNATDFWGQSTACSGSDSDGVCNGDGDNDIESSSAGAAGERFQFWRMLSKADLLPSDYSGIAGPNHANQCVAGDNCPNGPLVASTWLPAQISSWQSGSTTRFDGFYSAYFLFGGENSADEPSATILTPKEAFGIDTKADDGMPATGWIVPNSRVDCTNATSAVGDSDNFDAAYNLSDTSEQCALNFRQLFQNTFIE